MKISVDVVIGDINDDGTLSEEFSERLLESVAAAIHGHVKKTLETAISQKVSDRIDGWITDTLNTFTSRPIKVTDRYGDVQETHENVIELLKQKFDNFLGEKVDQYGKPTKACGYGDKSYTRIDHLIDSHIKAMSENFGKNLVKNAEALAQKYLTEELKKTLADKMAQGILSAAKVQ